MFYLSKQLEYIYKPVVGYKSVSMILTAHSKVKENEISCFALEESDRKRRSESDEDEEKLRNRLEKLSIRTTINYSDFKELDGEKCTLREFVSQFEPFHQEQGVKKTLEIIEVKLKDAEKNWFFGAKEDKIIKKYAGFKTQFLDMFEDLETDENILLLDKI